MIGDTARIVSIENRTCDICSTKAIAFGVKSGILGQKITWLCEQHRKEFQIKYIEKWKEGGL